MVTAYYLLHIVLFAINDIKHFKQCLLIECFIHVLSTGKFVAISILPADEMNSLTSEIKLWHKHRKSFKLAFSLAMCFGVMVLLATLTFALLWYAPDDYFPSLIQIDHYAKEGSLSYNVHMNLQVTNLLLMTVGNLFYTICTLYL